MKKTLRFAVLAAALMSVAGMNAQNMRLYKKATAVESGKAYALVADANGTLKAGKTITSNYGYINVDDATINEEGILLESQDNEYVIEAVEGGYTIKQNDGRYLYMTGTYNSYNLSATPTEGQVWTFEAQEDGTFKIVNVLKNKYVQYSITHTSFGCYASAQSNAVMPMLYEFVKEVEAQVEVTKVDNFKDFAAVAAGTAVELKLNNAQVLYVNDFNNTKELFVRDASGAVDLYNLGIDAKAGQVLNGTIKGKRGSHGNFTIAMEKSSITDVATVTVGEEQDIEPIEVAIDEATTAFMCELIIVKNVNIANGKATADGEELAVYDQFKLGLLSELKADVLYDVTGIMCEYQGDAELCVTNVTLAGGGEIVEEDPTAVASIEALLGLESPAANLELTLTNAKVLLVDGNYIYMRENGKAVCFYQVNVLKDTLKNNMEVSGTIRADYEVFKLLPELKANKHTNIENLTFVASEDEAQPVQTTLEKVANGDNVCDLVELEAKLSRETSENNSNTYYLSQGETKIVVVNNGKNLKALVDNNVEDVRVTGIVNTSSDKYQVKLVKPAVDLNAEDELVPVSADRQDNTVYNLQGQRVAAPVKGLYIVGGKKVILK